MIRGILLTIILLMSGHAMYAQELRAPDNPEWYLGYNGFRMLLEERGLTVRQVVTENLRQPRNSVIVMLGDSRGISRTEWLTYRRFAGQGGSLLIASDYAFHLPGVSDFSAGPVRLTGSEHRYQDFDDCIRLTELHPKHPLTRGLRSVIANRTGWLSPILDDSLNWNAVASLPEECYPQRAGGRPVIACGMDSQEDGGVLILAADQSVFSDGMLWHGDNSMLAIQVCDLLCRGERRWLTVFQDGRPLPAYIESLGKSGPVPTLPSVPPAVVPPVVPPVEVNSESVLQLANAVIDKVQKSDVLNETLRNRPRSFSPVAWLRTLLLVLLILLTMYVIRKLLQNRWHRVPLVPNRFLQSMYGVNSSRQLESSDFASAVEILARDLCREVTGSQFETVWLRELGDPSNPVIAALPRSLQKGLDEVLGYAGRGCRRRFSHRQFQAFGRTVQSLRRHFHLHPLRCPVLTP